MVRSRVDTWRTAVVFKRKVGIEPQKKLPCDALCVYTSYIYIGSDAEAPCEEQNQHNINQLGY